MPANELSEDDSYLGEGLGATARLTEEVMAQIEAKGPISFSNFFNLALYHPEWGYYARPQQARTGKEGDFFTAVSVGTLFGHILAEYARSCWQQAGQPEVFRIVEWGVEQGDLGRDIMAGARKTGGDFERALQYAVVEPLPLKRNALRQRQSEWEVVEKSAELKPLPGLVLGNELLDALSFWLVRWENGQWWEKRVGCVKEEEATSEGEKFCFEIATPGEALRERLRLVSGRFCEGYETEIRPSLSLLLAEMKSVLEGGEVLLFDYGFERDDLYHPSRTTGTLRTYGRHEAGEDPLLNLGQIDITAHVDFTALAEDARMVGLVPDALQSQGHFLTKAAAGLLTQMEGHVDSHFIRQFQTLTHPGHLGSKFSVFRARV